MQICLGAGAASDCGAALYVTVAGDSCSSVAVAKGVPISLLKAQNPGAHLVSQVHTAQPVSGCKGWPSPRHLLLPSSWSLASSVSENPFAVWLQDCSPSAIRAVSCRQGPRSACHRVQPTRQAGGAPCMPPAQQSAPASHTRSDTRAPFLSGHLRIILFGCMQLLEPNDHMKPVYPQP